MPYTNIVKFSGVVNDICVESDDEIIEIPLSLIHGIDIENLKILLEFVKEYVIYYENKEIQQLDKPLKTVLSDVISEWDNEYLNKIVQVEEKLIRTNTEIKLLEQLILLCNFLSIDPLLQLLCAKIASILRDKTTEEMREIMGVENDFTPEEEEKIKEENRWCEEA